MDEASKPLSSLSLVASGNVATGSTEYNQLYSGSASWPQTWPSPSNTMYYYPAPVLSDQYANELEIEARPHDATVRFFRKSKHARQLVAEITVPLALLSQFLPKRGTKR